MHRASFDVGGIRPWLLILKGYDAQRESEDCKKFC